jgi:general secretion pathway protein B
MSLILEALRKSEAERRRGEAPDLHAELAPVAAPAPAPRRQVALAAIAAVAVLLLAALVVWFGRQAPDGTAPASVQSPEDSGAAVGPISSSDSTPAGATASRAAAATLPTHLPPVERLEAPPPDSPPPDSSPDSRPPAAAAASGAAPAIDEARAVAPAPAPADAMPAPAAAVPVAPPPPRAAEAEVEARAAVPPPATPSIRPAGAAPAAGDLPKVSELAPEQRGRLPAMKLTLHMWNADPARRFVILDGTRHVEGDRVGSGRITAIDSAGVVIELDGRAFRLPLR